MQIQMIPIGKADFGGDVIKMFVSLTNAVRDQAVEGVRFISTYPPLESKNYRRTHTLQKSWSPSPVKTGGGRIEVEIGSNSNIAPYNEDVQGENQMAIFKRIGWRTVNDLESLVQKDFSKRLQDAIDKSF